MEYSSRDDRGVIHIEEQQRTLAAADHMLRTRALVPNLEKLSELTA